MSARWQVTCPDSARSFPSKEAAERHAATVTKIGACNWPHEVKEVK